MPTLVSPGVSVSITDESFFVPASAPTVPFILLATGEEKLQPDGVSPAIGTQEHSIMRTVTSLTQSTQLYGIPSFLQTVSAEPMHGDARNEYGLFALNQFLGLGNLAYVMRANVNLNDDRDFVEAMWVSRIQTAGIALEILTQTFINEFNAANGYVSGNPLFKETVTMTELLPLIDQVMVDAYDSYNFSSTIFATDFEADHTASPLDIYDATFTNIVGAFLGVDGAALDWVTNTLGSFPTKEDEWVPAETNTFLVDLGDDYPFTVEFLNYTALGANDAARRTSIITALQAAANLPALRSEAFEFNLILCPGYYEVTDEMITLALDINEEALVIGDTPMNMSPDDVVTWADSGVMGRQVSNNVAYYYSHGLASNLDGVDVLAASSGIALRTYTFSDNQAQVWFAPAGANRGIVSGVSQMGYFTGTAGTATTFVEATLNNGERDNLYKYDTNINPVTFLPGRGIVVMGQKTSAPVASALDRVNVIRLLAHIRRSLRKNTFAFVFEPNDQLTRDNLKTLVDNFLGDILTKRGLFDFATISDESNNTPDRIDRSEMYIDIALKPTKAAEFIYIPIRVLTTGAEL